MIFPVFGRFSFETFSWNPASSSNFAEEVLSLKTISSPVRGFMFPILASRSTDSEQNSFLELKMAHFWSQPACPQTPRECTKSQYPKICGFGYFDYPFGCWDLGFLCINGKFHRKLSGRSRWDKIFVSMLRVLDQFYRVFSMSCACRRNFLFCYRTMAVFRLPWVWPHFRRVFAKVGQFSFRRLGCGKFVRCVPFAPGLGNHRNG